MSGISSSSAIGSSGSFTPGLTSSVLNWKTSAPTTPRGPSEMDDTVMSYSASSTGTTRPGATGSVLGLEPQPTSIPISSTAGLSAPPVAPFSPPSGGSLFSFDELASADPTNNHQQQQRQQLTTSHSQQPQHQPHQQHYQQQPVGAGQQTLFDASETSFLTNFLSGFEGWDFNPNLPMDLPSFTEAEKSAYHLGTPPSAGYLENRRNSRQRGALGGAASRNRSSPYGNTINSPARMESSVGAAFANPMEGWNEEYDDNGGDRSRQSTASGKKMKTEHGSVDGMHNFTPTKPTAAQQQQIDAPEMMSESDKRNNHILSEQRRRNHIREAFKELVDLLEAGRDFGARGLGLSSGAGTGIEDEGLDDRSEYESTLEDEEPSAATKRRKTKARRRAAREEARKAGATGHAAAAAFINGGGRGKGRGRGGSAGGGAGSKSAVLFQAVDLLHWLDGRNEILTKHVKELEEAVAQAT